MDVIDDPEQAAAALAQGALVVLPTETVYGLGARADDPLAVARIYAVKGRPASHPLIVHLAHLDALKFWGRDIPSYATDLAQAFWPGSLTLVVTRSQRAAGFLTGGQDSVALRVASHPFLPRVFAQLIELTGDPAIGIAAPSANRFGKVSPTTIDHVIQELGGHLEPGDLILNGGSCPVGIESTIIDCTSSNPRLLRSGAVTEIDIERVTGLALTYDSTVRASGGLASHYAPAALVRLVSTGDLAAQVHQYAQGSVGLIASADTATPPGFVRLLAPTSTEEYAQHLYAALREADALKLSVILAIPPGTAGIGAAVRDRLSRAATPHSTPGRGTAPSPRRS